MTHLRDDQFVDVLMGEPHDAALDLHLSECEACQETFANLQHGLKAARIAEPRVPLLPMVPIRFARFKRQSMVSRLAWLGAAAMLLLSLLGFRLEVTDVGMAMSFSLMGQPAGDSVSDKRIRELEATLALAMDEMQAMTQHQINAGLSAFLAERDREIGSFQAVMANKFQALSIDREQQSIALREEIESMLRQEDLRGKLQ